LYAITNDLRRINNTVIVFETCRCWLREEKKEAQIQEQKGREDQK